MKKFNSIMSQLRLIFASLLLVINAFILIYFDFVDFFFATLTFFAVYFERKHYKLFLENKGNKPYLIGLIIVASILLFYDTVSLLKYGLAILLLLGYVTSCTLIIITTIIIIVSFFTLLYEVISSSTSKNEYDTSSAIDPIDILIKAKQLNDLKVLNDLEFEKIKHILNNSNSPTDANKCSLLVDRLMKLAECKKLSVLSDDEIMSRKCKYLSEAGINLYRNF